MKSRDETYITISNVNFKYLQLHASPVAVGDLARYKVRLCRDAKDRCFRAKSGKFLITICCNTFWRNRSKRRD